MPLRVAISERGETLTITHPLPRLLPLSSTFRDVNLSLPFKVLARHTIPSQSVDCEVSLLLKTCTSEIIRSLIMAQ